jgi:hypothetical protein
MSGHGSEACLIGAGLEMGLLDNRHWLSGARDSAPDRYLIPRKVSAWVAESVPDLDKMKDQGKIFSLGFTLFIGAFNVALYGLIVDPSQENTKLDPRYFTNLLFAVMQTAGLVCITLPDVDVNHYLKRNKIRLALILIVWFIFYVVMVLYVLVVSHQLVTILYVVEVLPFTYTFLNFRSIVEMRTDYPKITEVMVAVLVLDQVGEAGAWLGIAHVLHADLGLPMWPGFVAFGATFAGAICVLMSYKWSKNRGESLNVSFNTAIYTYLFVLGLSYLVSVHDALIADC